MPLTQCEIDFLGPVIAENAEVVNGPAWAILHQSGIRYTDLIWLMEAYQFVDPPRLVTRMRSDGTEFEALEIGRNTIPLPTCPWKDALSARQRNTEMEAEVRTLHQQKGKANAQ